MIEIMSASYLIERLVGIAEGHIDLDKSTTLFSAGDQVRNLYVVLKGSVRLIRHQESGGTVVLQRARSSALLAEASMFARRYHCSAVADVHSRVACISRGRIEALQRDDVTWLREWAMHLAGEVQRARARAEILALRTVAQRLSAWLLVWGPDLPEKGSWVGLAEEIGVSSEALYREISRRTRAAPPLR